MAVPPPSLASLPAGWSALRQRPKAREFRCEELKYFFSDCLVKQSSKAVSILGKGSVDLRTRSRYLDCSVLCDSHTKIPQNLELLGGLGQARNYWDPWQDSQGFHSRWSPYNRPKDRKRISTRPDQAHRNVLYWGANTAIPKTNRWSWIPSVTEKSWRDPTSGTPSAAAHWSLWAPNTEVGDGERLPESSWSEQTRLF